MAQEAAENRGNELGAGPAEGRGFAQYGPVAVPGPIRAGSFTSVKDLTDAITTYLAERIENPKPYRWKEDGEKILAKIHRARQALEGA